MSDVPKQPGATIFVVGTENNKWVVLECPCGCRDRIDVNLMATRSPYWRLTLKDGKATLYPSLWRPDTSCGSHFWIRNSSVKWIAEEDSAPLPALH